MWTGLPQCYRMNPFLFRKTYVQKLFLLFSFLVFLDKLEKVLHGLGF